MPRKASSAAPQGAQPVYRSKPLAPRVKDSYRRREKTAGVTKCNECGAVYHQGRWAWAPAMEAAHEQLCPACQRMHDHQPAGFLNLLGPFVAAHEQEIRSLAASVESAERKEHPLQRIMAIECAPEGGLLITTTDSHLARRLSEAIQSAFQGSVKYRYGPEENLLRADWMR